MYKRQTYTFDEMIQHGETDKGFKVKATDIYDQVRICLLYTSTPNSRSSKGEDTSCP